MRKRLIALATALAFVCLLDPNVAFASAVPVTIEIGADGAPIGTSGEGWTYADGKLTLGAGHAFTFTGHALNVSSENLLRNKGVIEDGTFVDASQTSGFAVRNEAGGVIRGGAFTASIGNAGIIAGGTFNSDPNDPTKSYVSTSSGTITGGTFDCMVMGMRSGAIEDGTFNESVNIFKGFAINGGTFNGEVNSGNSSNLGGSICGGTFNGRMQNQGTIEDGVFHGTVQNASNNAGAGAIAGGTFNGYVNNYDGAVISSGTFNDGGENNNVTNDGTIRGGEFNIGVDNGGAIEGQGVFNAYVQNGYMRFDPDENRSCTIKGGTFNSDEIDNFGTIEGGTFSGKILSRGVIAGGAFSSTSSVTSNDEDTTTGGGTISGGTFDGTVTNGDPDPDYNNAVLTGGTFNGSVTNHGTIAGGTFLSDVTNRGVIEGGIFENVISDQGGTVTSCAYPLRANLTGLSIAAVPSAMPKNTAAGFPAEPSAALTAAFEKDGADANLYQLSANEGYLLPDAIDVRCGAADGQTLALAAGTDYTYDPATGAIAIKKSVVTGPLLLAAQGAAAPTPPVPPTPDTPAPAPEPETPAPKPESKPDAPKPLPSTTDSKQAPANAAALAATGDASRRRRNADLRDRHADHAEKAEQPLVANERGHRQRTGHVERQHGGSLHETRPFLHKKTRRLIFRGRSLQQQFEQPKKTAGQGSALPNKGARFRFVAPFLSPVRQTSHLFVHRRGNLLHNRHRQTTQRGSPLTANGAERKKNESPAWAIRPLGPASRARAQAMSR